ncbi:unnamed protein product [Musa textilis]
MENLDQYKKGSGSSNKWDGGCSGGPGGGSGGGPYGVGPGGRHGPYTLSDLRSNDHSSLPACGSCCGGLRCDPGLLLEQFYVTGKDFVKMVVIYSINHFSLQ